MMVRLVLGCAAAAAILSSPAQAASSREPTEVRLSTVGVNFSRPESVETFYGALRRAARKACNSHMPRDLGVRAADRACAAEAIERAVQDLNQPVLTALHEGRTVEPATMLAAIRR